MLAHEPHAESPASSSLGSSLPRSHPLQPRHPRTPSFGTSTATPNFSSPETPYLNLQTPAQPPSIAKGDEHMEVDPPRDESGEKVGLDRGEVVQDKGKEKAFGRDEVSVEELGMGTSTSATSQDRSTRSSPADNEEGFRRFPQDEDLKRLQSRLEEMDGERRKDGDGWGQRDELAGMVRQLLTPAMEELPFFRQQINAQRETIKTIQQQAKIAEQLMRIERERHSAERAGWYTETRALNKVREAEITAGIRPKKLLDLDVGYHQELEASNKRLEMDNRLMAPRLADTQRQIDKLVTELQLLRSHVVLSSEPLASSVGNQPLHSMTEMKPQSPAKQFTGQGPTTMGDARTEHLLLAARKVRSMRAQDDRIGRLTLEELKRGGVVGPDGGVGYSEGYGGGAIEEEETEELLSDSEDEKLMITDRRSSAIKGKGKGKVGTTPLLPRAKRSGKKSLPIPTTPRGRASAQQHPETTPGGGMFSDLLRAAEMATRPGTPTPSGTIKAVPMSAMSATRSTHQNRDESTSDRGSPVKRPRREAPTPAWGQERCPPAETGEAQKVDEAESAAHQEASALDILAQASQLDVAQSQPGSQSSTGPLASAARLGGMMEGDDAGSSPRSSGPENGLAPAIDLRIGSGDAQVFNRQALGVQIEDHQIDPSLSDLPRDDTTAQTPKSRPRAPSNASGIHTPARGPASQAYHLSLSDRPFDESPITIHGPSPPSVARSDATVQEMGPGAFASPTGATVPGLGKYVHLTSSMPARRVRSPYLKWTVEEDELLARAVAIHGEKWDLVSKGVPTRSYHQVRQRWLRKSGAFDKKPQTGDGGQLGVTGGNGGGGEEEEDDGSPTPATGKTTEGKKRKASVAA